MKNVVRTICLVAVVLFLGACPALGVLEFKDGLTHDINYTINDWVYVDYQAPSMFTTVNWLAGGSLLSPRCLCGYEQSRINVRGGSIDNFLLSYDSSQVNISGGSIWALRSHDSSQVNISGGLIDGYIESDDSSQVNISGGSIGLLENHGSSQVNISGGHIRTVGGPHFGQINISGGSIDVLYGEVSNRVNISGGSINSIYSLNSSQVDISGGTIGNRLWIFDASQVNIYGGTIGNALQLWDNSTIRIFGSDFAVNGQPFGFGELTSIFGGDPSNEPLRYLTGTLLSGELINNDFYIGHDARIILIPEPASAIMLGLGGLLFASRRRQR